MTTTKITHLLALLLLLLSGGELSAQTTYAKTLEVTSPHASFSIEELAENIRPFTASTIKYTRIRVKNGQSSNNATIFVVTLPNNYTNIQKNDGPFEIIPGTHGTTLRFTGAGIGAFNYRYTAEDGATQERRIDMDINYYGVLQMAGAEVGSQELSENTMLVVNQSNKTASIIAPSAIVANWWDIALEGSDDFIELGNNIPQMSLSQLLLEAQKIPNFTGKIKLRVDFNDGTSNLLANAKMGGRSQANLVIDFSQILAPQSHTITARAFPTSWGSVSPASQTLTHGNNATVTATPATGYNFVRWEEDGAEVSNQAVYSFSVTGTRNLKAIFTPQSHTITARAFPTSWGSVSPASQTLTHGNNATVTATPATGYRFVKWINTISGVLLSTQPQYTFQPNQSLQITAEFEATAPTTYAITANVKDNVGGSVAPATQSIAHGNNTTVTATPATGYTFVRWEENGAEVSTQARYSFSVTAGRTLSAVFSAKTYTIEATSNNNTWGKATPATQSVAHGNNVTVTAIPEVGYTFVRWEENGAEVSTQGSYSFSATAGRTLVAVFEAIAPTTYAITANVKDHIGGSVAPATQSIAHGNTAVVTATPATGYTFVRWEENGAEVSNQARYSFSVTAGRTLVAVFKAKALPTPENLQSVAYQRALELRWNKTGNETQWILTLWANGTQLSETIVQNTPSYVVKNLTPNTAYHIKIVASDNGVVSAPLSADLTTEPFTNQEIKVPHLVINQPVKKGEAFDIHWADLQDTATTMAYRLEQPTGEVVSQWFVYDSQAQTLRITQSGKYKIVVTLSNNPQNWTEYIHEIEVLE